MSDIATLRPIRGVLLCVVVVLSGCSTVRLRDHTLIPTGHRTDVGPYVVHSNFPLPADAPAVVELGRLRRQVEQTLGIPIEAGPGSIEVYILDDSRAFAHFLNTYYNELPHRRAFFLAQGDRRVIYTFLGDRLAEDLRHEATHALMHTQVVDMPLWLDEGLAEYFEDAGPEVGENPEHLDRLSDEIRRWKPDLARLEAMQEVRDMTPRDYRESWAWVHFLVRGSPARRAVLAGYLRDLRRGVDPVAPLSRRLAADGGDPEAELTEHVRGMLGKPPTLASERRVPTSTVRLQSHPAAETIRDSRPERTASRRSPLAGLARGFLGLFRPER